ncbi:MAG: T9SS type A sorting domain-containing protein [Duncaniella sp.]|nr:T9SS type A sorting domain-containing protein [Duncaniella sp.]
MRHLLTILVVALWALTASSAAPRWESVSVPVVPQTELKVDENGVDVAVSDGYIYIGTPRPVTVKVFTILGQLISQESLTSGTHRLRMTARGVYILKIGSSTRRVTI